MGVRLAHRGPDGSGVWASTSGNVALAHRRLAIVDLSEHGRQPMLSPDGRFAITFNGEIYNYCELRAELISAGREFSGTGDTEVLLAAVAQWGIPAALKRLVGMFAFALWDEAAQKLFIARDRLGEKPLHIGSHDGLLFFASELRALREVPGLTDTLSERAISGFLRDGYVPGALSMYEGVWKLPPGTFLEVAADSGHRLPTDWQSWMSLERAPSGVIRPSRYWDCEDVAVRGRLALESNETDAAARLEDLLRQSVRMQMRADVPMGSFLSGGIDSTLVSALMQKQSDTPIHTFTVAFDNPRYDESQYARAIAKHLGTIHEEFVLREAEIVDRVPSLVSALDEPTANASFFPVYMISELARRRVKVVLSGDGGDELFGGYNRYAFSERAWRAVGGIPSGVRGLSGRTLKSINLRRVDSLSRILSTILPFSAQASGGGQLDKLARILLAPDFAASYEAITRCWPDQVSLTAGIEVPPRNWSHRMDSRLSQMMLSDQMDYLPGDSLAKVDRASMAVSLETRLPFLDHRVVENSWTISDGLKIHGGVSKSILKTILARHVPRELFERRKMGFTVPLDGWLTGPLRDWASDMMQTTRYLQGLPFRDGAVKNAWNGYLKRGTPTPYQIWALVMLAGWLEKDATRAA